MTGTRGGATPSLPSDYRTGPTCRSCTARPPAWAPTPTRTSRLPPSLHSWASLPALVPWKSFPSPSIFCREPGRCRAEPALSLRAVGLWESWLTSLFPGSSLLIMVALSPPGWGGWGSVYITGAQPSAKTHQSGWHWGWCLDPQARARAPDPPSRLPGPPWPLGPTCLTQGTYWSACRPPDYKLPQGRAVD